MALRWNDIDQGNRTATQLAARLLTVSISNIEPQSPGYCLITLDLYDGNNQPYQYVSGDHAVIDLLVGDDAYVKPHPDYSFGGIIGSAYAGHGTGTGNAQYWAEDYRFKVWINAPQAPATTAYVAINQGYGSTYYIRSAQRAYAVVIG